MIGMDFYPTRLPFLNFVMEPMSGFRRRTSALIAAVKGIDVQKVTARSYPNFLYACRLHLLFGALQYRPAVVVKSTARASPAKSQDCCGCVLADLLAADRITSRRRSHHLQFQLGSTPACVPPRFAPGSASRSPAAGYWSGCCPRCGRRSPPPCSAWPLPPPVRHRNPGVNACGFPAAGAGSCRA